MKYYLTIFLLFFSSLIVNAQQKTEKAKTTELEEKINQLEQKIIEMEKRSTEKQKEDELQQLMKEAQRLASEEKKDESTLSKKFHTGVRQQSGLNPNISMGGDFFAGISTSKQNFISEPGDISYGNNRFTLREIEIAFVAPLDPFTRGKAFISIADDEIGIEEAYMEWLNLPANLNLKVGAFYADFGTLNRYHTHALPQFDRPKVLVNLFGVEGLSGYGFGGNFLLPQLFWGDATNLDLSIVRGGDNLSYTKDGKYNMLAIGKLNNYYDLNRDTYFEWSLSGIAGKNDPQEKYLSYIADFGVTLKWAPVDRSKYRTIDWKTEFLYSARETPFTTVKSKGFYTSLQNKLSARYGLSCRLGYSELPFDNEQYEWDFTACVDIWQSEFVFFRFQYQYSKRNFTDYLNNSGVFPNDSSFIFQTCWAMGPHKHEAY